VNLAEISAALRDETGRVALQLRRRKETLPVSRIYSDLFKAM
jgi:DNA-binding LytR/AlgR family response regulator